jgi:hypothetical protein
VCDRKQIVTEVFFIAKITTVTTGQVASLGGTMRKLERRQVYIMGDVQECALKCGEYRLFNNLKFRKIFKD